MLAAHSLLVPRISTELGVAAKMSHQQSVRSYVHRRPENATQTQIIPQECQSTGRVFVRTESDFPMSLSKVGTLFLSLYVFYVRGALTILLNNSKYFCGFI